MCRITLLSGKGLTTLQRKMIFHQTMMYAAVDHEQTDGAGYTDGKFVVKTADPYYDLSSQYLNHLSEDRIWLGHVRKASRGTGLATRDAHPYDFTSGGKRMVFMHNGYVLGQSVHQDDKASTDSYRAGRELARILNGKELTPAIVSEWVKTFTYGSQWAFGIYYDDKVYLIRGQRELWALPISEDALLINTRQEVLLKVRQWMAIMTPEIPTSASPVLVAEHTMVTFTQDGEYYGDSYTYTEPAPPAAVPTIYLNDGKAVRWA